MLTIKVLQVLYGDSIIVRFLGADSKFHNIFVDAGFVGTYARTVKAETEKILRANEKIDIFVITHIDQDHIGGILNFIKEYGEKDIVENYWFNGGMCDLNISDSNKISYSQGITLDNYLKRINKLPKIPITNDLPKLEFNGISITILSPDKECLERFLSKWNKCEKDKKGVKISACENDWKYEIEQLIQNEFIEDERLENNVSIAFVLECNSKSVLFLGDSKPSIVINALKCRGYSRSKKMKVDYVKISHHGSKGNTNYELLSLIDCNSFIVSANGQNQYNFPHKEALVKILTNPERDFNKEIELIFNYKNKEIESIFKDLDYKKYNFKCLYPNEGENGYVIEL